MRFRLRGSAARLLGSFFYCETQVRVRSCISDNNYTRNSVFHRAKLVVDVGVGYFQRLDRLRACSLSWRRDLRRAFFGSLIIFFVLPPNCRPATLYSGKFVFSFSPQFTTTNMCPLPTTQVRQKMICFSSCFWSSWLAKLLGMSFLSIEKCWKKKMNEGTGTGEVQRKGSAGSGEFANVRFPLRGDCGPSTRFLLRRYASAGPKMHFGQQLFTKWSCPSCQYRRRC